VEEAYTMAVTVKFFANVRKLMEKEEITFDLDPSRRYTIKDVLRHVTESENKDLSTLLLEVKGESRGTVRVVVNGKEIRSLDGSQATIQNGDCITIYPLLAGG
jgi:molybdopterin converting factor small subunit